MRLLINCSNLRFGGGKTVGFNIVEYFLNDTDHEIVLVAPYQCGYEQYADRRLTLVTLPQKYNSPIRKYALNHRVLPGIEKEHQPDFILSLGNIAFPAVKPQLLLIQFSYLVYPESIVWKRLNWKSHLLLRLMVKTISSHLKYADYIRLQTATMLKRFKTQFSQYTEVGIVPNSIAITSMKQVEPLSLNTLPAKIPLLFLSKLYPHKNFDILLEIAEIIKKQQLPFTFSLTINKGESAESARFLEKVESLNLGDILINKGNIPVEDVPRLYEEHWGMFLPTFLESFSGTYIEALHFGRPVFTSNFDFAHEVCQSNAYYFDPQNPENIIEVIVNAFKDIDTMQQKIEQGKLLSQNVQSWEEIGDDLNKFIINLK
jgi:glycosyltransferase involved in cell wall biosynthesis